MSTNPNPNPNPVSNQDILDQLRASARDAAAERARIAEEAAQMEQAQMDALNRGFSELTRTIGTDGAKTRVHVSRETQRSTRTILGALSLSAKTFWIAVIAGIIAFLWRFVAMGGTTTIFGDRIFNGLLAGVVVFAAVILVAECISGIRLRNKLANQQPQQPAQPQQGNGGAQPQQPQQPAQPQSQNS